MDKKQIVFIVFCVAGAIAGMIIYNVFFKQSDVAEYDKDDWSRSRCLGVAFEAPFELSVMDMELPDYVRKMIKTMENYKYDSKAIALFISRTEYQEGVKVNIDGAVQGSVTNIKASREITDLTYDVTNNYDNTFEGRIVKGKYKINKKDAEFIAHFYVNNLKMLQILITNLDIPENREVRDRILKSVRVTL
ncbi:MAG: hypothetical protein JXA06_06390 [Bacteroidetes bacterium]|nr:hypothetical protein [Bacteroidota bacterium]